MTTKGDKKVPKKSLTAWRACHPDLRSSNGFVWPFPGKKASAPLPEGAEFTTGNPCPAFPGDGLCLAKTWAGAASGGIPAITCLEVTYDPADVLGEDADKIRVTRCKVVAIFDATLLIREGFMAGASLVGASLVGANLDGANLYGANLVGANLDRANLYRANLDGANLVGANLVGANLYRANLYGANLDGASLDGANLYGASLVGASLVGANLYRANLYGANLVGANLDRANLYRANLDGVWHDKWTRWPHGFDVGRLK